MCDFTYLLHFLCEINNNINWYSMLRCVVRILYINIVNAGSDVPHTCIDDVNRTQSGWTVVIGNNCYVIGRKLPVVAYKKNKK